MVVIEQEEAKAKEKAEEVLEVVEELSVEEDYQTELDTQKAIEISMGCVGEARRQFHQLLGKALRSLFSAKMSSQQ
jgi:hypothetical protein